MQNLLDLHSCQCLRTERDKVEMWRVLYASTVESLIYVMVYTRSDIAFTVGTVSPYISNLGVENQAQRGLVCELTLRVNRHSNGQDSPLCHHYAL